MHREAAHWLYYEICWILERFIILMRSHVILIYSMCMLFFSSSVLHLSFGHISSLQRRLTRHGIRSSRHFSVGKIANVALKRFINPDTIKSKNLTSFILELIIFLGWEWNNEQAAKYNIIRLNISFVIFFFRLALYVPVRPSTRLGDAWVSVCVCVWEVFHFTTLSLCM